MKETKKITGKMLDDLRANGFLDVRLMDDGRFHLVQPGDNLQAVLDQDHMRQLGEDFLKAANGAAN